MPTSTEQLIELASHPHEAFAVELKGWLDPSAPEAKAKIVKACIALRNNNGGYLLIGFDDKTLNAQVEGAPSNLTTTFHPDRIQSLITKYASEAFETHVQIVEVGGVSVVVIEVEGGVRSPVAVKADLMNGTDRILQCNKVYVRTLLSSGRISTSEAQWTDWERLTDICFQNREADIGAFMRRHLLGLSAQSIEALGVALMNATRPQPPIEESAIGLLDRGYRQFELAVGKRPPLNFPTHGTWEIAAAIHPPLVAGKANEDLLNVVHSRNPDYTGWPVWTDTRGFSDKDDRPYVMDGGWEALIVTETLIASRHLDFWRIQPDGALYLRRGLQEDLSSGRGAPTPGTTLGYELAIWRTAEAVAVALAMCQALANNEERQLAIACRWRNLAGRELKSWSDRGQMIFPGRRAQQDSIVTTTVLPLATAPTGIVDSVEKLVAPMVALFDGFEFDRNVYEGLIQRLLTRRL